MRTALVASAIAGLIVVGSHAGSASAQDQPAIYSAVYVGEVNGATAYVEATFEDYPEVYVGTDIYGGYVLMDAVMYIGQSAYHFDGRIIGGTAYSDLYGPGVIDRDIAVQFIDGLQAFTLTLDPHSDYPGPTFYFTMAQ